MKRKKQAKSRWAKFLEGVTGAEFIIFLIAASGVDSPDPTVPVILALQAVAWLYFVGRNLDFDYVGEDEEPPRTGYRRVGYIEQSLYIIAGWWRLRKEKRRK